MATGSDRFPGHQKTEERPGRKARLTNTTQRQLAHQVAQGRKVSFWPSYDEYPITGYVAGWDSPEIGPQANYFVIVPTNEKDDDEHYIVEQHLIPQAGTRMKLHLFATFDEEDAFKEMDEIVTKFRNFVIHNVIQGSKESREARGRG